MQAEEIAEAIMMVGLYNDNLNRQLCELAGLSKEYEEADQETFDRVVYKAAEILGVDIL